MKEILANIKKEPVSTGVGLAGVLVILAKLFGLDIAKTVGMSESEIILYFGAAIQSLLLIIGKDPKDVKEWIKNIFKKKEDK